jgi:formamidopyrimidine-DNA glycosylase
MIEIPEAQILARQINERLKGRKIERTTANKSPHKFAWYHGDPENYHEVLKGKVITEAVSYGGLLEIKAGDASILLGDGVNLKYNAQDEKLPEKHQLLIEFDDSSALIASVQMYGGLWCFREGDFESPYFSVAKDKPSPLSGAFDSRYFEMLITSPGAEKLSAKALLAAEQRIPGLGNGVLQDILFNAGIHPKKKVKDFTGEDADKLYDSIKYTLSGMVSLGGRDTEKDLFGHSGGYITRLSRNTSGKPCPVCGSPIIKEAYMGGSVYYCSRCQAEG